MRREQAGLSSSDKTCVSTNFNVMDGSQKPIEIFVFVDPLCPECWSLEPCLKKLATEYGNYLTIRPIISGHLNYLNKDKRFDRPKQLKDIWEKTACRTGMSCDGDVWIDNPVTSPWFASLAVKAAELQGKKSGRLFLRKLQESLFLRKQNISDEAIINQCAQTVKLDIEEFNKDLYSDAAKRAFQRDIKLTKEMEVDYIPTIVFFNEAIEQHGIKISGIYPYEIYTRILSQMLNQTITPAEKPSLETFLDQYRVVGTNEIATVYDWSIAKTEKELKKLQLKQKVTKIPVKHGSFWEYKK